MGAPRRRMIAASMVSALAMTALVSCSDDDASGPVSQATYDEAAQDQCDRQAGDVDLDLASSLQSSGVSDAERVAFLRTEFVPRVRAIVRGVNRVGFPPERDAEYREALSSVLDALTDLDDEDEAYQYLDQLRRGVIEEADDPAVRIAQGLADADIPC